MKWLQILLFNTNCSIQHYSLICTLSNGPNYCYVSLKIQFWTVHMYQILPPWAGCNTMLIFIRGTVGLNSEFSFSLTGCRTKSKGISISHYLHIARGKRDGLMSLPRLLSRSETQAASSRIWTRIANTISCESNHYTILPPVELMEIYRSG